MGGNSRKFAAEFLGTFTLVFVGTAVAVLQGLHSGHGTTGALSIAFAFGFTLMVLVYTIGPISGCHVNPAVSLPMAISGRLPMALLPGYIVSQCVGAIVASLVLRLLLTGHPGYDITLHGIGANGNPQVLTTATLFLWELVLTALFLFVIFGSTSKSAAPGVAGLAIGGYLFVAHLIGAPLGDSSLNPARSLGPALVQRGEPLHLLWVFVAAPLAGGLIGLGLFRTASEE